jgi:hypothetical protein
MGFVRTGECRSYSCVLELSTMPQRHIEERGVAPRFVPSALDGSEATNNVNPQTSEYEVSMALTCTNTAPIKAPMTHTMPCMDHVGAGHATAEQDGLLCRNSENSDFNFDRLCGLVVRVPGYRSRDLVRFTALPDFLRSSGPGTGSSQPREYN